MNAVMAHGLRATELLGELSVYAKRTIPGGSSGRGPHHGPRRPEIDPPTLNSDVAHFKINSSRCRFKLKMIPKMFYWWSSLIYYFECNVKVIHLCTCVCKHAFGMFAMGILICRYQISQISAGIMLLSIIN